MTRADYNAHWNAARRPGDLVRFRLYGGYDAESSEYDPDCSACFLSHAHTWAEHDISIARKRGKNADRS